MSLGSRSSREIQIVLALILPAVIVICLKQFSQSAEGGVARFSPATAAGKYLEHVNAIRSRAIRIGGHFRIRDLAYPRPLTQQEAETIAASELVPYHERLNEMVANLTNPDGSLHPGGEKLIRHAQWEHARRVDALLNGIDPGQEVRTQMTMSPNAHRLDQSIVWDDGNVASRQVVITQGNQQESWELRDAMQAPNAWRTWESKPPSAPIATEAHYCPHLALAPFFETWDVGDSKDLGDGTVSYELVNPETPEGNRASRAAEAYGVTRVTALLRASDGMPMRYEMRTRDGGLWQTVAFDSYESFDGVLWPREAVIQTYRPEAPYAALCDYPAQETRVVCDGVEVDVVLTAASFRFEPPKGN